MVAGHGVDGGAGAWLRARISNSSSSAVMDVFLRATRRPLPVGRPPEGAVVGALGSMAVAKGWKEAAVDKKHARQR